MFLKLDFPVFGMGLAVTSAEYILELMLTYVTEVVLGVKG